jgi:multiple sugar transport system permease protein
MDGAGRWRAFYDVTLPALLPTVFIVALIRAIDSFKEFDKVYIITGGGPGTASELSSLYIWRVAFRQWNFGYGAALCVVVYCLIYAFSRIGAGQVRAGRRS